MISKLLILKILQLFCFMIIGFVLTKIKVIKNEDSSVLSRLCLYLLMPSAILNAFDFEKTGQMGRGLLLSFGAAIAVHAVLYILDCMYGKFISKNAVERASLMYSNAGNLIIPIVSFVLGNEWVVYSTAYLSVQLIFIWSHGINLFSKDEKFSIKKVLLNVNIIAIMLGVMMMLTGLRLPSFVKNITTPLGDMVGTVGMLIAGILAANINFKKSLTDKRLYRAVLMRMIVYPMVSLVVLKLLSLIPVENNGKILLISFLASITPSAATVMQFAQIKDCEPEYAATINIFTTIACIVTMPLLVMLFDCI